nr:hypothetical protein CFP56_37084 [Quercus suber]
MRRTVEREGYAWRGGEEGFLVRERGERRFAGRREHHPAVRNSLVSEIKAGMSEQAHLMDMMSDDASELLCRRPKSNRGALPEVRIANRIKSLDISVLLLYS